MLTLFTVKMKWHYNDEPTIAKFCAVTQEEADFLSCFLICQGEDLKLLYNGCYVDENYPCHDIIKYKLKLLVAALNGLYPQGAHILEKTNDYDIIQIVLYRLNDITGWRFKDRFGHPASIESYESEDLSTRTIVSIDEINALIQKKYSDNPYVDKDGVVAAAVERGRKHLLAQANKTWRIKE